MLTPLKQWYCDACGDIIEKPENGSVIWRTDENGLELDFKIIHQGKCDSQFAYPLSKSLDTFLGEKGIQYLLQFLSVGKIKMKLGQSRGVRVKDMDEFVDFFRRVQTPYYEEARMKFGEEELLKDLSDDDEMGPYLEERLKYKM